MVLEQLLESGLKLKPGKLYGNLLEYLGYLIPEGLS